MEPIEETQLRLEPLSDFDHLPEIILHLPREHEHRRTWLALFVENSHCLRGVETIWIYHLGRLETDVWAIIDKLRTLVPLVSIVDREGW